MRDGKRMRGAVRVPASARAAGLAVAAAATLVACSPGDRPPNVADAEARWLEAAGPVMPWPRPVPIRLTAPDGDGEDVLVTLLGDVSTPLADGMFDPEADRVTLRDGSVIEDYYRDRLDVPYYAPIDKSEFPLPPAGWCSWYYYYREVKPAEVLANARWISDHLLDYGMRWVQIDDGWQAEGDSLGGWRDWTGLDPDFQAIGMDGMADSIRSLGLEAGVWLAPHGQSNIEPARASDAFIFKDDGTSLPSWVGRYLLDPTSPAMAGYLTDLFDRLRKWGFTYFKIDGQTVVLRQYEQGLGDMRGPVPDGDPAVVAAELYRRTLAPIREAIGDRSYLLSSWGTAVPGVGYFNGARTGGDVVLGRWGYLTGVASTQRWAFLHNVAWYSDPDVLLVRPPMTDGLARSWASMIGLTGQSLMADDRLPDLPPSRVEMLKRVLPPTDIRALDLYRPENVRKSVVDLKVSHLGRDYDVVGVFNYDEEAELGRHVGWADLGLDPVRRYHVFDFWSGVYLGAWAGGVFVDVPATDVRVLTLVPAGDAPALVSTSRHITQGWVDLKALELGDDTAPSLGGRSRIIAGDPYVLTIGLPPAVGAEAAAGAVAASPTAPAAAAPWGHPSFRIASATARGDDAGVDIDYESHIGYATVTLTSDATQEVDWAVEFEPTDVWVYPPRMPTGLAAEVGEAGGDAARPVHLRWRPEYYSVAGYQVSVDGRPAGVAFESRATLTLSPGEHTVAVREVWYDGTVGDEAATVVVTVPAGR